MFRVLQSSFERARWIGWVCRSVPVIHSSEWTIGCTVGRKGWYCRSRRWPVPTRGPLRRPCPVSPTVPPHKTVPTSRPTQCGTKCTRLAMYQMYQSHYLPDTLAPRVVPNVPNQWYFYHSLDICWLFKYSASLTDTLRNKGKTEKQKFSFRALRSEVGEWRIIKMSC